MTNRGFQFIFHDYSELPQLMPQRVQLEHLALKATCQDAQTDGLAPFCFQVPWLSKVEKSSEISSSSHYTAPAINKHGQPSETLVRVCM